MIIELRKKSQITIPKGVVNELQLLEGDYFEVSVVNGIIQLEPIAVYSKTYINRLEKLANDIQQNPKHREFSSLEEIKSYLSGDKDEK